MEIFVRKFNDYRSVIVDIGGTQINIPMLDKQERGDIAVTLLGAVYELIGSDFGSHADFVQFVLEQYE